MKKNINIILAFSTLALASTMISCNQAAKSDKEDTTVEVVVEEEPVQTWLIAEHHVNEIPVTSVGKKTKAPVKQTVEEKAASKTATSTPVEEEYDIVSVAELDLVLVEMEYAPVEEITVTEAIIPLDEEQTLVSYSKKGKAEDTLQVISSGDGEIQQIVFSKKHHKDVYDVENGMSAKEVKKLRKEMKHMVKHGKVFLYNDDSNVLYLLDAVDTEGNEVLEAEVDTMNVQAIIWQDKKHHKKNK